MNLLIQPILRKKGQIKTLAHQKRRFIVVWGKKFISLQINQLMESIIKWGMIGCGDVTEVKSGPAFSKVPNSKLVAVMSRNPERAADYARRHQIARWYDDAQKLIEDPEVNAIYIATPPLSHEAYTCCL
jgi:hypothetical protein